MHTGAPRQRQILSDEEQGGSGVFQQKGKASAGKGKASDGGVQERIGKTVFHVLEYGRVCTGAAPQHTFIAAFVYDE